MRVFEIIIKSNIIAVYLFCNIIKVIISVFNSI